MDIIQSNLKQYVKGFFSVVVFVAIIVVFVRLAASISVKSGNEGVDLTYQSLRRAAVQCYALEGAYPSDFAYLKDHYGIKPDETKYAIYYDYIASNLMPDITVLPVWAVENFEAVE